MELKSYLSELEKSGASYCRVIPVSRIVTSDWVRLKCQFGCGAYGSRLSCPPYSPTPSQTQGMLRQYMNAIFVAFRVPGSGSERSLRRRMRRSLVAVERELFLDGYYSAFAMAFGPCNLCPSCDVTVECKYPELARPSMEACGIDVYATAQKAGFPLTVVRTRDEGCVMCGLILLGKRASRNGTSGRGTRRGRAATKHPAKAAGRMTRQERKSRNANR
jgi:predicted metal-binding protein